MIGDIKKTEQHHIEKAIFVVNKVLEKIKNKPIIVSIGGFSGTGKCFAPNTKIIMSDGTIKMIKNISLGDKVLIPGGGFSEVKSIHSGYDDMYKINQKNGNSYVVNSKHILSLIKSNIYTIEFLNKNNKRKRIYIKLPDTILNIPINIYIDKYFNNSNSDVKGYKSAVEFPQKQLSIEPYFLGLWLSDDRNNEDSIYSPENEIKNYLLKYCKKINLKIKIYNYKKNKYPYYSILRNNRKNNFKKILKKYNLINNKYIPKDYLINSRKNRLQLLAGLLDINGIYNKGGYVIILKYKNLSNDILFLARSLGFRCSLKEKIVKLKNWKEPRKYYRIFIYDFINKIPCKIKRKQINKQKINKNLLKCGINVEYVGKGNYIGIELKGKNKLFLLEDFTVVHNSEITEEAQQLLYKNNITSFAMANDDYYLTIPSERKNYRIQTNIIGHKELNWDKINKITKAFKDQTTTYIQEYHLYSDKFLHTEFNFSGIKVLFFEGLYAGYLKKKDLYFYLDANYSQTYRFRKTRGKENPDDNFRKKVLRIEAEEIKLTKDKADYIIPYTFA